jgi:hypothetical protein
MVGVPGRSRACATCKKRRIACDSLVPPCGPCSRSKRVCTFPQKHIFVLNAEGSHKTIYRKRTGIGQHEVAPGIADTTVGLASHHQQPEADQSSERLSTAIVSRPFGTLTALKQQLLVHACAGNPIVTHGPYRGQPWTLMITAFANSIHALNSAPLACYASWAGRRDGAPYLVEVSRRLYVQGKIHFDVHLVRHLLIASNTTRASRSSGSCNESKKSIAGRDFWGMSGSYYLRGFGMS